MSTVKNISRRTTKNKKQKNKNGDWSLRTQTTCTEMISEVEKRCEACSPRGLSTDSNVLEEKKWKVAASINVLQDT